MNGTTNSSFRNAISILVISLLKYKPLYKPFYNPLRKCVSPGAYNCGSLRYIIKVLSTEAKIVNTLRLITESTKNSFQHTTEHYLQAAFRQLK